MSTAWESLANEPILDIHPYQPGKPVEELERELGIPGAVKLASNENPYGPPAGVLEALRQALAGLNRYPDGSGYYLRQALAKKHGVSAESIVLGNGSNELIELLARTFVKHGEEVVIPHPSFVVYPSIVQAVGGIRVVVTLKDHRLDLPKMRRAITGLTKMVFVANPNNPTGTIVTAEEVEKFLDKMPERVIVVFDEAYYDFAAGPDFPDTLAHLRDGKRVVILRTFSKMASLAGLRVGYAIADPDCVAADEPDPPALQREHAGPGRGAGGPPRRAPRPVVGRGRPRGHAAHHDGARRHGRARTCRAAPTSSWWSCPMRRACTRRS